MMRLETLQRKDQIKLKILDSQAIPQDLPIPDFFKYERTQIEKEEVDYYFICRRTVVM